MRKAVQGTREIPRRFLRLTALELFLKYAFMVAQLTGRVD
jgi:hypothetical protein